MKLAFLLSKGLLCFYDKQNNTWLLVDMEFLFSCSTRHLTRSLHSLVSYRVKHSNRNSISTRAHAWYIMVIELSGVQFIMVIALSGVQFGLKSYAWFQNRTGVQREFDLKSQVWFQTKIARHEVQLPLYYIHFEITQIQDLVSSNILLMQYWAGLKLYSSIFLGGKCKSFGRKSCKICRMILFVFKTSLKIWLVVFFFV